MISKTIKVAVGITLCSLLLNCKQDVQPSGVVNGQAEIQQTFDSHVPESIEVEVREPERFEKEAYHEDPRFYNFVVFKVPEYEILPNWTPVFKGRKTYLIPRRRYFDNMQHEPLKKNVFFINENGEKEYIKEFEWP